MPDVAIVFGGDGAVHRVLASLAYTETPLLVVPTGSANDFARCLGIPNRSEALRAWRRYLDRGDNVRTIDLGAVRPMADFASSEADPFNSATFADAEGRPARRVRSVRPSCAHNSIAPRRQPNIRACSFSAASPDSVWTPRPTGAPILCQFGCVRRGGYLLAALGALADYAPPIVRLHSYDACGQETCLDGPVLFTAIGNAPEYGSGMRMLPQAQLDDGQLDLCFVPAMSKSLCPAPFLSHLFRNPPSGAEVRYFRTRQVFLESDQPIAIYADGEYLCQTPAEISASSKALRVIVP